jgi:hypothetical protein
VSPTDRPIFFEFPNSPIRGIPLISESREYLNLGFMEVGCKPTRKRTQLRDKKELFYKWWGDQYKNQHGIEWTPTVYRILAHYCPEIQPRLYARKTELDVVVLYTEISPEMLGGLNEYDKEQIYRVVKNNQRRRDLLEEIIETKDAESLHKLIVEGGRIPQVEMLRGKMAEILAQKDIEENLPFGMNFFRNSSINYFNRRYRNGTEIDGVLTFYGEETFMELVERFGTIDHLTIKDRWN